MIDPRISGQVQHELAYRPGHVDSKLVRIVEVKAGRGVGRGPAVKGDS